MGVWAILLLWLFVSVAVSLGLASVLGQDREQPELVAVDDELRSAAA